MKSVLVVSDNPELSQAFLAEWERQGLGARARARLCYSAVNRAPEAMIRLGAAPIDMKDPATAEEVAGGHALVLSLHCKQLFPGRVVTGTTCVNLHPGLNPWNRGWYPQVFSIVNHLPAGATLHVMDEEIDHGAIVAQRAVAVCAEDTSLDVYRRIVEAEKALLREHLASLVDGTFTSTAAPAGGNYNSIADFRRLCRLDLDARGTLREHLDLLRALTHGEFRNAWFEAEDGARVWVRVRLEREPGRGEG